MDIDVADIVATYIGTPIIFIFAFFLVLCGLKTFMAMAAKSPSFFLLIKTFALLQGIFALLLLLRDDVPKKIALLQIWIATIEFQSFPYLVIYQAAISLTISWVYWIHRALTLDLIFFEYFGDITTFVIIPTIFILSLLNYETRLISADYKLYGPHIPISKYI